jgi:hypothetical protein
MLLITYLINLVLCFTVLTLIRKKPCLHDSFFIATVYMVVKIILWRYITNHGLCEILSIISTTILYCTVFEPIVYPKKEVKNESNVDIE